MELNFRETSPFPVGFTPTFHRYRLDEPQKVKKPSTIFVGSMTDLFGEWVPDEWIAAVFEACEKASQHRYIFLTKNQMRLRKSNFPHKENFWYGSTVTDYSQDFFWSESKNVFLSIEPIHSNFGAITIPESPMVHWVIVGAESGNRKGKVIPKRKWIENIANECAKAKVPLFMKDSLKDIWGEPFIQQLPWEVYAV